MPYLIKVILSAIIIVVVSEVSKRSTLIGGLTASLPLVSILSLVWLYTDTKDMEKVSELSWSIFWFVLPSLAFFVILPLLLKRQIPFYMALTGSMLVASSVYYLASLLYVRMGIR